MQLRLTFSALLAGVLIALSANDAAAVPVTKRSGMVTLPLKRMHQARSDVHPLVYLQQHINRANRRLARMTGREAPSDLELRDALNKRLLSLEEDPAMAKRFNRIGVSKSGRSEDDESLSKRYNRVSLKGHQLHKADGGNAIVEAAKSIFSGGLTQGRKKKHGQGNGSGNGGNAAGGAATGTGSAGTGTGATGTGAGSATGSTAQIDIPADVTVSDTPDTANSLALDIEGQDVGYVATVQIGTPPRDFLILFDSGSSDFWVGAEDCQSQDATQQGCGNHNFLGATSSSSFVDTGKPFSVTYGTGNVAGTIITDDIALAGLPLKGHSFGVATSESVEFSTDATSFDGLMGFAQSSLSNQKVLTPIESLAEQGLINEAITSYKIPRFEDNLKDGEVTLGGLDATKFDSASLVTLPNVNVQGFWEADMDAVTVDGTDTGLAGRTAIVDTGTTLIIAPTDDAVAVHQLIPGASQDAQGNFLIPCDTTATVALSFGGTSFDIDVRDMVVQTISGNDCLSGIQAGNIGGATEWLVGDVFIKNAYFSHDVGKNTLSLAKLV